MFSGLFLVLCLFLVPMDVLSTESIKCGENVEFSSSYDAGNTINTVVLTVSNGTINVTEEERCSHNEKFCMKVSKDRKQVNLTVHGATSKDQGKYTLNIEDNKGEINRPTFSLTVEGMCEPKLADEARQVQMCCTVPYEKEEKQNYQDPPSQVGSDKVNATEKKNVIIIPILCVLCLAICVALYISWRRRISFTQRNRERTLSETGLMDDHQAENMDGAPSEPLQRPQDQV